MTALHRLQMCAASPTPRMLRTFELMAASWTQPFHPSRAASSWCVTRSCSRARTATLSSGLPSAASASPQPLQRSIAGYLCVECEDYRRVMVVDTHNKMARIDGRFVHWVRSFGPAGCDRYSLIFYATAGEGAATPRGRAVHADWRPLAQGWACS